MTEELTAVLGRNPGLRVIATTSGSALQARGLGVTHIAERLGVAHVLEGRTTRGGRYPTYADSSSTACTGA